MSDDVILQCENLQKSYRDGKHKVTVLQGINFSVKKNQTVAILGTSGSGKSTLLHLLAGLDKPTHGQVLWQGKSISRLSEAKRCSMRNSALGFVYQFHHLLAEFNALENVAMPLLIRQVDNKAAEKAAKDILEKVGLSHRLTHKVSELSGGERQRVAIARALVGKPSCVLADEPTGNLDTSAAEEVFNVMLTLQAEFQTSFVIVTHDQALADRLEKQHHLENGKLT